MATNYRARLEALEQSSGLLPDDVSLWSDAELEAASAAEPLSAMLGALSDEDLERIRDADDDTPLCEVLPHLGHPATWPAATEWSEEARAAACAAWDGDAPPFTYRGD